MKLHNWRALRARMMFLFVLGVMCTSAIVNAATLSPAQNVSNDPSNSLQPRVAQDPDGNVHVVWVEDDGGRKVRYTKGIWNGTAYAFGASAVLADVGSFQYSLPNVAVAPNGMLMVAWSDGTLRARVWNARDAQPGGGVSAIGNGIQASIAVDSASRFHVAWSGDSLIQYCQWEAGSCTKRDTISIDAANRPDIAVDSNDSVHIVWDGGGIKYRGRAKGAGWGTQQTLSNGIKAQIAADGQGTVHIVYSNDYNIQYCRKTLVGGCVEPHTIDAGNDLDPSVGVTPAGSVIVGFRDATSGLLRYALRENGAWGAPQQVAGGITIDVAPRLYAERTSFVWSRDYDIQHAALTLVATPPPPKFTGKLTINGGATTTNSSQVTVDITNTSADAVPTAYSIADGADPGSPNLPFSNPTTSRSFTLDIADGRCRAHTVNAKLGGTTGQSATFSSTIVYDASAEAGVEVRNPNLPFNPTLNDYLATAVPSGDTAYTRRPDFNTGIWNTPNECSGLARYALVKRGNTLASTDWRAMPAEGYVSAFTSFTPNLPTNHGQGAYQFEVYVEDKIGNKSSAPYVVTIMYDTTGPTVQGANGALPTTHSPKGGVAFLNTGSLTIDDNLYVEPVSGRKQWGYWVLVKKDSAGAPTETDWNVAGAVQVGKPANTLRWNMANGLVGGFTDFTPGPHTVYMRYLDGAGNWSSTVASASIPVNQLEFFNNLPLSMR